MGIKEEAVEQEKEQNDSPVVKKRWIGKGIYGKGDIPIKILDGMIIGFIIAAIGLVIVFALNGGYYVTFDTDGGSAIEEQKLSHGDKISIPETPVKPGYQFVHWVTSEDEYLAEVWDFSEDKVEGDETLYAVWEPIQITVKFDTDGGKFAQEDMEYEKQVMFGEVYGELPIPEKEGYVFDGWIYSQQVIESDTVVFMTGEHVLTARWTEE